MRRQCLSLQKLRNQKQYSVPCSWTVQAFTPVSDQEQSTKEKQWLHDSMLLLLLYLKEKTTISVIESVVAIAF